MKPTLSCTTPAPRHILTGAFKAMTGALALISSTNASASRHLQSSEAALGMRLNPNSTYCAYLNQDGVQSDVTKLLDLHCDNEFVAVPKLPANTPLTIQHPLLDGSEILCSSPETPELKEQLDAALQCIKDVKDAETIKETQDTFYFPFFMGGILPVATAQYALTASSSNYLRNAASLEHFAASASVTSLPGTALTIAAQLTGLGLLQFKNDEVYFNFGLDALERSAVGSLTLAATSGFLAFVGTSLSRSEHGRPHFCAPGLVSLLNALTFYSQAYHGAKLGGIILNNKAENSSSDTAQEFAGMIAIGVVITAYCLAAKAAGRNIHLPYSQARIPAEINPHNLRGPAGQRPNAVVANGVHVVDNQNIAYEQLSTLKNLDARLQLQSPQTTAETMDLIQRAATSIRQEQQKHTADTSGIDSIIANAQLFLNTSNDFRNVFDHEFGTLEVSPDDTIGMIWRASIALAQHADETGEPLAVAPEPTSAPENPAAENTTEEKAADIESGLQITQVLTHTPETHVDKMKLRLYEQMALISTTVHGAGSATNPCGSGKVGSLLQYVGTFLPELDLFRHKLTSLPISNFVQNEYFAEFNRAIDRLYTTSPQLPTGEQEKAHLKNIYVTQQDRMTSNIFETLYNTYTTQLEGTV